MLFREGDRSDKLFIVVSGTFKVTKQIVFYATEKESKGTQYESEFDKNNCKSGGRSDLKKRTKIGANFASRTVDLALRVVGAREVLGDEDAFMENKNQRYMTSCQCISEAGEAYEIRQEDF